MGIHKLILRISLVIFDLTVLCISSVCQSDESFFLLKFATGPTFPISEFAEKTFSNTHGDSAGLAKTGIGIDVTFGYHVRKKFGGAVLIGGSLNKQDKSSYENYLKKVYGNDAKTEATTHSWKILKLLAGPFFETAFSKNIRFRITALAGTCKSTKPSFTMKATVGTNPANMFVTSSSREKVPLKWAFAYQFNSGLLFNANGKYFFSTDIGFFNSNPKFIYYYRPDPVGSPSLIVQKEGKQSISYLSVSIGAGINF